MQVGNMMQIHRLRKDIAGILLITSAMFLSPGVLAVKMGEVAETSALSRPLDVRIELTQLNGLDAEDFSVSFASASDFSAAGIDYSPYIELIDIEVLVSDSNSGSIRLTSKTPLNEPYLTFLLQLRSGQGLVIREFTILPRLPAFSAASQEPVRTASSSASSASASGQLPDTGENETVEYELSNPDAELTLPDGTEQGSTSTDVRQPGGDEYIIQAGDTLWAIARQVRPSDDISVHQTMIALQRANPRAFPSGNINNIRPLAVLRVPSTQQIMSLSSSEAIAEVQRQNRVSQGLEAEPLVMNQVESDSRPEEENDELSVVSAEGAMNAGTDGSGSQAAAQLENEILLAEETIDRLSVENEELESRITELSSQIELLENMVTVKDEQIAELNQQAAELAAENQGQVAVLDPGLSPSPASGDANDSDNLVNETFSVLQDNLQLVAAGAGVILLFILGLVYYRKRKNEDEVFEDDSDDGLADEDAELTDIINTSAAVAEAVTDEEDDEVGNEQGRNMSPETVYEVRDDVEDSYAEEDLDGIDDDFYSIIQVDEDDLARAVTDDAKNDSDKETAGKDDADPDELMGVLGTSETDMNPNRDLRDELAENESLYFTDAADEISSVISDLDEPVEAGESGGDTEDLGDDDFSGFTFEEEHAFDDAEGKSETVAEGGNSERVGEDNDQESSSNVDLAVAYEAMGDLNGARELLQKALFEGSEEERIQARKLLDEWKGK